MSQPPKRVIRCEVLAGWLVDPEALREWTAATGAPSPTDINFGILCNRIERTYRKIRPDCVEYPRLVPPKQQKFHLLFPTRRHNYAPYTYKFSETEEDRAILQRIIALDPDNLGILLANATFVTQPDPCGSIKFAEETVQRLEDLDPYLQKFAIEHGIFSPDGKKLK